MAVTVRSTSGVKEYFGLAADTKPTSNTPTGSYFFEYDTGLMYRYAGSAWGVLSTGARPVASASYSPLTAFNWGTLTKAIVKAAAGNVYSLLVTNSNAAARYFQLHNKATAPVATEVPQLSFVVPAGTLTQPSTLEINSAFFAPSERFTTGIGWAISSTLGTFTDGATGTDHTVQVRYV